MFTLKCKRDTIVYKVYALHATNPGSNSDTAYEP